MSDVATKQDIDKVLEAVFGIKIQVDGLESRFDALELKMDIQFTQVNERLEKIDAKFEDKFNTIMVSVDGFVKRLDTADIEQAARDAQFGRLTDWARKSSVKNGIPLKNL